MQQSNSSLKIIQANFINNKPKEIKPLELAEIQAMSKDRNIKPQLSKLHFKEQTL